MELPRERMSAGIEQGWPRFAAAWAAKWIQENCPGFERCDRRKDSHRRLRAPYFFWAGPLLKSTRFRWRRKEGADTPRWPAPDCQSAEATRRPYGRMRGARPAGSASGATSNVTRSIRYLDERSGSGSGKVSKFSEFKERSGTTTTRFAEASNGRTLPRRISDSLWPAGYSDWRGSRRFSMNDRYPVTRAVISRSGGSSYGVIPSGVTAQRNDRSFPSQ